jgi:cytochrome c553
VKIVTGILVAAVFVAGCGRTEYPPTAEGRYLARCARCHEPDGSSATASEQAKKHVDLRAPLFQQSVTDEDIARVILQGTGRMMPITGLTDAEMDSVILHVRRLGAARTSTLDTPRTAD